MKIKELFKKVEIANEVLKLSSKDKYYNEEYTIYMDYDNFRCYKFTTYKQFKKKVKDEFVPDFAKALIEIEFEIGKVFYINNTKLIFYVD